MYSEEDIYYKEAKKRVVRVKKFYRHLGTYLIMGAFFFILNITTDPGEIWFIFPMLGWGIGLAMHYLSVFGFPFVGTLDKKWEDQKIREEIARMKGQKVEPTLLLEEENHQVDDLDLESDNYKGFDLEDDFQVRDMKDLKDDFNERFIP